jgi:hypothetical protein
MTLNEIKLRLLLALLRAFRAQFTFDGDQYHERASYVIRDIRFALGEHGGFYRCSGMRGDWRTLD